MRRVGFVDGRRGSEGGVHDPDRPFLVLVGNHLYRSGAQEHEHYY